VDPGGKTDSHTLSCPGSWQSFPRLLCLPDPSGLASGAARDLMPADGIWETRGVGACGEGHGDWRFEESTERKGGVKLSMVQGRLGSEGTWQVHKQRPRRACSQWVVSLGYTVLLWNGKVL